MIRGPNYLGHIINGRFELDNRDVFAEAIKRLEGKRIALTLCEYRPTRSAAQNAWYWGVAIPAIAEAMGMDKGAKAAQQVHEGLKYTILPHNVEGPFPIIGSTSTMNTKEFSVYMEDVVRVAAQMFDGLYIELPNEHGLLEEPQGGRRQISGNTEAES